MHVILVICLFKIASADIVVQTSSGLIRGRSSISGDVEAFLGIPYAEPPIGDLRFAKPVPKMPWTGVFNATKLPPPCIQPSPIIPLYFMPDLSNMSEDCLYLNLWTPKTVPNDTLKPVIIFIHPGSFTFGASSLATYDGENFAKRGEVIVITFNFRLGPFGYFLANIEEANGNMGMYDQIMAIKWLKENAGVFGGDPENIVLMGESSGGMSVAAHLLSPVSKNIFQKAIIQSGNMVVPYFFYGNSRLLKNSQTLASFAGCSNETVTLKSDPYSVVHCLKHQSVEAILNASITLIIASGPLSFYPSINDEFLPQSAINLFREGKFRNDIPILTGINNEEGTMIIINVLSALSPEFNFSSKNNSRTITKGIARVFLRAITAFCNVSNPSEVVNYYFSQVKNPTSEEYIKVIGNTLGDYSIACSSVFGADFFSLKGNPVYFYKFKFRPVSTTNPEWIGATHLDEIQYIFGNPYQGDFTEEETTLSHLMIDRWSTFARTGDPNVPGQLPWLRYTYDNPYYLSIEQEEECIRVQPLERCKFWRKRFKSDIDPELIKFLQTSN